jgi:small-conductance mechanosensitive channel
MWASELPVWAATLLDVPLKILLIVIGSFLVRFMVRRLIEQIAERIASSTAGLGRPEEKAPMATAVLAASPLLSARRRQRARTTASILNSAAAAAIGMIAVLTILPLVGVSMAPLLTSISVIGVAVGIGAQALVKDILSGIFMIMEDQYGVGDFVDIGHARGTVEGVGLRVTRLRDGDGAIWYVRNGEIMRVGNHSQGWARAVLDVAVPLGVPDLDRVSALLRDVGRGLAEDEAFAGDLVDEPRVWGVEGTSTDAVVLRLSVRTEPLRQWDVTRELRRRILERFAAEGLPAPVGLESPPAPQA